jgi:hypothetical protein
MSWRPVNAGACRPQTHACAQTCAPLRRAASLRCCSGEYYLAMGRMFCQQLALLLAKHLPVCYLSRKSRQPASFDELQSCRRLPSMEEKSMRQ